ncbi:MAG: hypothetical protein JWM81_1142 [Candidatus Saccharibacteria bacterium]|nr:hypothetical protein [Candidatus Saccharibacteria bacterium]
MKAIRGFLSLYSLRYPATIVYMLQSTEYNTAAYLKWYWRTKDYSTITYRRSLDYTRPARLLLLALRLGIGLQLLLSLVLIGLGLADILGGGLLFGIGLIIIYPVLWANLVVIPLVLGRIFISKPAEAKLIKQSKTIFADHKGIKIAVAGSYGKTTMKEMLLTVLSEGLNVAATPANKNVSSSHAYFARKLTGKEDVLVIEYGEGEPGDIARFAAITQPTHAVITGVAPAHLDRYKTLKAAGQDIFSISQFVDADKLFVNADSPDARPFIKPQFQSFDNHSALGWSVKDVDVTLDGTSFTMHKDKTAISLKSGLIGEHQVGFLVFVAALGLQLGLTQAQVKAGIAKTKPFEHRMQPYRLSGAAIIDDTYNGNLEGIRAGTALLKRLEARRKLYVTPGLVEQGAESAAIHTEVGRLIAEANPDMVVLMKNSVTGYIKAGLAEKNYRGELRVEEDPLYFYTNIGHFVAAGDLVVMQNDWTDNYA